MRCKSTRLVKLGDIRPYVMFRFTLTSERPALFPRIKGDVIVAPKLMPTL